MWEKARFLSYFIEFCVVKETVDGTPPVRSGRIRLKPGPEFVEGSFGARLGARRGVARRSPEGQGRSGGGGVQS